MMLQQYMKQGKDQLRVKLLIIGESYVGKSSLLNQYVDEAFNQSHTTTIGVEYKQKLMELDGGTVIRIQIWDTAGTARYNTITPNYYRDVDGILMVFDITNTKSFEMINFWIKEVNEKTDFSKIDFLLVGNKIDLDQQRQVHTKDALKLANDIGIAYLETSAKTFQSTRCAFDKLVGKILVRKTKLEIKESQEGFRLRQHKDTANKKEDKCC